MQSEVKSGKSKIPSKLPLYALYERPYVVVFRSRKILQSKMFTVLIVLLSVLALIRGDDYPKVTVEVYYEALCPGCQGFITGPLTDALLKEDIAAITDLKMVPYGNTKYSNGVYTCQHGTDECTSDVYEQCVLYKLAGNISAINTGETSLTAFPYLQCMELAEGDPSVSESCYNENLAESVGISWDVISTCASEESDDVQAEAALATPTHDYVPWILVDDTLLEHTNALVASICKAYTGPSPSSCKFTNTEHSVCLNK